MRISAMYVASTMLTLLIWCTLSLHVSAHKAVVTTDQLHVRSGPGTTHEIIGQVNDKDQFTIIQQKNDWVQIKWNEQKGWIAKWLVRIEDDAHLTKQYAKVDYLRIREKPGLNAKVLDYLMKNDEVVVRETDGKWTYIIKANTKGWVHSSYLSNKKDKPVKRSESAQPVESNKEAKGQIKVATPTLNVRSTASLSGKILTQVHGGDVVTYIQKQDGWYLIKTEQTSGWIAGWLVNEMKSGNGPEATAIEMAYNGTNIRSGPTTNDAIIGRAKKGDRFNVLSKHGRWYKIDFHGNEGYVASWIVRKSEQSPQHSNIVRGSLKGKVIMLDAGHGGRDSGAIGSAGTFEKTLTLNTAFTLKDQLQRLGAKVLFTRDQDEYISLSMRTYLANYSKADLFISLHYNSAPPTVLAHGISTFYYHKRDKNLASSIQKQLVETVQLKDRGVRYGDFHVLRENKKPSVLLELGFLSNTREEQTIRSSRYRERVASGISKGILAYYSH